MPIIDGSYTPVSDTRREPSRIVSDLRVGGQEVEVGFDCHADWGADVGVSIFAEVLGAEGLRPYSPHTS
jgi:hypothetical protein